MVDASRIRFRAGGRDLLCGIDARFDAGRLHLVMGPNGAGKSTLIRVLARLVRPAAGRVRYDEVDVAETSDHALARRRAVLSQAVEVAFPLTVRELVAMGRYPHHGTRPTAADESIVDEVMAYFEVADMRDRQYPTLSGGEKQRVNFARVLAQVWRSQPETTRVLFLDEPLTFLDIRHQFDFMRKVRSMAARPDMVVIGVVHDLNLASRFADRLLLLDRGTVAADGTPAEVLTPASVKAVFGVETVVSPLPGTGRVHLEFE